MNSFCIEENRKNNKYSHKNWLKNKIAIIYDNVT
jgi:hypothetical protein